MLRSCLRFSALAGLALLVALPAAAKDVQMARPALTKEMKDIVVVPANPVTPVELNIRINKPTVAIGDFVKFDFISSADGYVTLWDVGTSGKVTRIYPNRHGGDMQVAADTPYGAGGRDDGFAFQVGGPPGMEDVYLVWTRSPEAQPKEFDYRSATALAKDLNVVERLDEKDWATAKVTFEITEDGRPQTAQVTEPDATISTGSSEVYILAMGANVGQLTKTNADARHFVTVMQRLFNVPNNHIRLLENAYKRDFADSMAWLRQNTDPNDLVLIFFSGHGSTIKDDDGDESDGLDEIFIMYDVEGNNNPSAEHVVRDDEFAAWTSSLPADQIITFIDACHSGGLRKSMTNARTKFFVGGELGRMPDSVGWQQKAKSLLRKDLAGGLDGDQRLTGVKSSVKGLIYAAAQEEEYALEVADGGLFITRLLQQASQSQNANLADLFAETQQLVKKESRGQQTPTAVGDTDLGKVLYLKADSR